MNGPAIWIDSHAHLQQIQPAERGRVLDEAREAGVGGFLVPATQLDEAEDLLRLAHQHADVWCSLGVHPHDASTWREGDFERLRGLVRDPKVVAVGEAGLDYYYKNGSPEAQAEGFRAHIAAARETGLPLEIHTREADADTLAILEDEHKKGAFPAVLHCYTGGRELALRAVDLGLYVSFSGVISFKKTEALQEIARDVPLDRILVETDAPFLAPVPYRGKTNEPAYVVHTASALARIRGVSEAEIARATTDNFFRLYTKARRPQTAEMAAP